MGYYDSTARKLSEPNRRLKTSNVKKVKRKVKPKKKNNLVNVLYIVSIFSMLMFVSYRYNLINEKNMKVMDLKTESDILNSNLASIQTDLIQNTDLTEIESYAKQKLGMQKPNKSQIVYIDTSSESEIVKNNETDFFANITNIIKEYIKNI